MRFTVVTIFPEMFESALVAGVVGRARAAGTIAVKFINPRDFTSDRHRTVDDTPYGGGPGMVMKVEPLVAAIEAAAGQAATGPEATEATEASEATGDRASDDEPRPSPLRILMSPRGAPFDQARARALAARDHIVLVCGRYEGIDERVSELVIDDEISLGDFVLSGGEIAALAVIDAVSRYVPGVLGEATSTDEESFSTDLLEYPHYTRPASFRGLSVPDILLSGHHGRIAEWRHERAQAITAQRRPDLLARSPASAGSARRSAPPALFARTHVALVHHPVYDRTRRVVTTALTNLDLHDIARSAATYGLAGYHVVTPVANQREKVERIVGSWRRSEQRGADNRIDALDLVRAAASVEEVIEAVAASHGSRPWVVATSARSGLPAISARALASERQAQSDRPMVLLFGTGWGLGDSVLDQSDQVLMPIRGAPDFNHLSVRSAVAIVLDRLFGRRES